MSLAELDPSGREVFNALNAQFHGALELQNFFGGGSTARVYHVKQKLGLAETYQVDRIAKVFRQDAVGMPPDAFSGAFKRELETLLAVSHTNIVSLYDAGHLTLADSTTSFYLMEYLPEGRDLDDFLLDDTLDLGPPGERRTFVLELLVQIAAGLAGLHSQGILHCDLKLGNVLLGRFGPDRIAKVTDFGFSKRVVSVAAAGETAIYTTLEYLPRRYRQPPFLKRTSDVRRVVVEIPRAELTAQFDLHYYGRLMGKLLAREEIRAAFTEFDLAYLERLKARLDLDNEVELQRYGSASHVLQDLRKLSRFYVGTAGIPELGGPGGARVLRLPVSGNVPFTDRVKAIVDHPWFARLQTAMQLGYTYLVFPGATHTRFEHSLGVYAQAVEYMQALLGSAATPHFRQLMSEDILETTLVAALLHDIAQHSFAHILEDDLNFARHERAAKAFLTGEGIETYLPGRLVALAPPLWETVSAGWPQVSQKLLLWLVAKVEPEGVDVGPAWQMARRIVDGALDADKMDYLLRDAHHAGVEYTRSIDKYRLLGSLAALLVEPAGGGGGLEGEIGITWKGQASAENLVIARAQMFRVLYWHHTVRVAHAMFGRATAHHLAALDAGQRQSFNCFLYTMPIYQVCEELARSGAGETRAIAEMLRDRRLFKRLAEYPYPHELYDVLQRVREKTGRRDPGFIDFCARVTDEINKRAGKVVVRPGELLLDVPKPGKDEVGRIMYLPKGSDVPIPFRSELLEGQAAQWGKTTRQARLFVHPNTPRSVRGEILRHVNGAVALVASKVAPP